MLKIFIFAIVLTFSAGAYAQNNQGNIDYKNLEQNGYGNVAKILEKMTPEQRKQIEDQAKSMLQDAKKMSPEEIQQLDAQMRGINNGINPDKIDVQKLDASKVKGLNGARKDIDTYEKNKDKHNENLKKKSHRN